MITWLSIIYPVVLNHLLIKALMCFRIAQLLLRQT